MTHPRGNNHPKRPRFIRETGAENPELAMKFGDELRAIMAAMGTDAPDLDAHVVPVSRGGRCLFLVGNSMLTWDDATETAWKIHHANGSERFEGWRRGKRIGDVHPPREPWMN
jgi:hypothetical protein